MIDLAHKDGLDGWITGAAYILEFGIRARYHWMAWDDIMTKFVHYYELYVCSLMAPP